MENYNPYANDADLEPTGVNTHWSPSAGGLQDWSMRWKRESKYEG